MAATARKTFYLERPKPDPVGKEKKWGNILKKCADEFELKRYQIKPSSRRKPQK